MFFSGGLVPFYLLLVNLKLYNSFWVYVIPALYQVWNIVLLRTFFMQLPVSLEESAKMDGANDMVVFFKIVTEKIELLTNITTTEHLSPLYFALLMSAFSISLTGAIKLYRMQRIGLYYYLTAQAMILFLPIIWFGSNAFSVTNAIFTLLFSGVYLYYYRLYSNDKSAIVSR